MSILEIYSHLLYSYMIPIKNYFRAFFMTFLKPIPLYKEIETGKKYHSWICVLIYCLFYVFASLWLYFNDYTPFVEPWITLPEKTYYFIQSFYILPVIFLMWITAAGTIHIISKAFKGKGRFDVLFQMTGWSLWAPWYLLIIVDCIHSTPEIIYNTVLVLCMLFIIFSTAVAVRVEEKISVFGAVLATLIAFCSIGLITFTYIR